MIRHAEVDGPRPVTPAEFADTIALCNRILRPHGPASIAAEYPCVLTPANAEHMWIVKADGRVVSHAASYAATMQFGAGAAVRLGGIGSVATDPTVRQRGYASALVRACCDDLRAQGCHLAVLWTELKGFYEKLGFASLGSELLFRLTPADLRDVRPAEKIAAYAAADLEAIMALRAAVRPAILRPREVWNAYFGIPKTRVWVARQRGRCVAYLVVGKGEDFRNCAHEWAGEPTALLSLLAHAARKSPRREVILLSPDDASPLPVLLQRRNTPSIRLALGMFACLDPVGLCAALRPLLEPQLGAPLEMDAGEGGWRVRVGDATAGPLATETVAELFLGPRRAGELLPRAPALAARLERALPIPLFIWGLDSV